MEIILAVAVVVLAVIQGQRNYLIIQQMKQAQPVQVTVNPSEVSQAHYVQVPEIDYEKLAEAIAQQPAQVINVQPTVVQPTVIPNPTPTYPSGPWWQSPTVSSEQINTFQEQERLITINDGTEVPVRSFPRRVNGRGGSE